MLLRYLLHAFVLIFIVFLGSFVPASAQSDAVGIPERHHALILSMAQHFSGDPPIIDTVMADLGFSAHRTDGSVPEGFNEWPDLRKLEFAHRSVIAAGGDGEDFLRDVAREIAATRVNSIRYEATLKAFFPEPDEVKIEQTGRTHRFVRPISAEPGSIPRSLRAILMTISRYSAVAPGGMVSLMVSCCNLSEARAFEILMSSTNREHALVHAFVRSGVPPSEFEKVSRAARHVMDRVHGVSLDPAFANALQSPVDEARFDSNPDAEIARMADEIARNALRDGGLPEAAAQLAANPGAAIDAGLGGGAFAEIDAANKANYQNIVDQVRSSDGDGAGGPALKGTQTTIGTLPRNGGGETRAGTARKLPGGGGLSFANRPGFTGV